MRGVAGTEKETSACLPLVWRVCVWGGGAGVDLGPINSGRLAYDPRVPPGLAGRLEINGPGQ